MDLFYRSTRSKDESYAGHVALYIGNGKIVHASGVKTGIKIGYATYREILSVRRIV